MEWEDWASRRLEEGRKPSVLSCVKPNKHEPFSGNVKVAFGYVSLRLGDIIRATDRILGVINQKVLLC